MGMSTTSRTLRPRRLARIRRGAVRTRPVASFPDLHLEVAAGEVVSVVSGDSAERAALLRAFQDRGSACAGTFAVAGEVRMTDDLDVAIAHADRIVVLGQGRILHQVHLAAPQPRDLDSESLVALRTRLAAALRSQSTPA